jgi:hypothetical protein
VVEAYDPEIRGRLEAIVRRLTDLGAVLETRAVITVTGPEPATAPFVHIPVQDGVLEIHPVLDGDVCNIARRMEGVECYLIESGGRLDAQIVVLGEGAAEVARIIALGLPAT